MFANWCESKRIHPFAPSLPRIVDFFVFLRKVKNLSVSAIEGYRACLNPFFKLAGEDYTNTPILEMLFKSFRKDIKREGPKIPPWDINVVLQALRDDPYEPAWQVSLLDFTKKTLFLVSLATVNRVNELAALNHQVGWAQVGSIILSFAPDFIARNKTHKHFVNRTFIIKPLSHFTDKEEDLLLCPVRAIKHYLRLSKANPRSKRLFVSPRDCNKALSPNGISYFLRTTIKSAFINISDDHILSTRVKAHEVRAIAVSLRFSYNISHVNLIKKAYWRSN